VSRRLLPLAFVFLIVGLSTAMAAPFLTLFLNQAVHATGVQVAVFLAAAVIVSQVIGRSWVWPSRPATASRTPPASWSARRHWPCF
jgi:hypothetical protein